eukprot:TRINITY_DN2319_c0_g1_i1.p1 TRINITY_DN2319_c0_g1~~TRINITY_DN2319_c0_g1_i1.p1  ORF type:complete len:652 (+),score=65.17 TRINITY_DN2319_c0_g1_i1:65-1957(+)
MCSRLPVCSASSGRMSYTSLAGPASFPAGRPDTAWQNSTSSSRRSPSASRSRPGSGGRTQLSTVGAAVTFSCALAKERVDEVALKLGNFHRHGTSSSSLSMSSTTAGNEGSSRPSSKNSTSSSEGWVGDKLEQMGISSLVVAATLSRLSPRVGVKDALNALCQEPGLPLDESKDFWECQICFEMQETYGWQCPEGHRFCRSCMRHHVKAVAFPRCPQVKCCYEMNVADLRLLKISRKRVEAFEHGKLQTAIETLGYDSSSGTCSERVVHCRKDGCSNVMLVPQSDCRECFACPCGAPSFCTKCGETPYHFHADCKQVNELRKRWFAWVGEARTFRKKQAEAYAELQKRMDADFILQRDEAWKMKNCKLCPQCNRVVEKLDGCNAMKCGQNFHGGDKQQGCGATFDWTEAVPYTPQISTRKLKPLLPAREGKGIYHHGITCKVCEQTVFGPRLRCIHCESFDVCADCEAGLDSHDLSHVFEVIATSDFDWTTVLLPQGLTVRFVRSGGKLPPRWHGNQFEGKVGTIKGVVDKNDKAAHIKGISDRDTGSSTTTYTVSIEGHRGSDPEMPAEHVVPIFESRWQASKVAEGTWKQGMRQHRGGFDTEAFYAAVAAHGSLHACRMMNQGAFERR